MWIVSTEARIRPANRGRLGQGSAREDSEKLIAAPPAGVVIVPRAFLERLRSLEEGVVADRVTELVVDLLEPVDVHHDDAEALLLAPRTVQFEAGTVM